VLGTLVLLAVINPWLLLAMAPTCLAFSRLRASYVAVSREVKRLEATSRSPIFSLLAELAGGLTTVRAFGLAPRMLARMHAVVDENGSAYWAWLATARWLGIRLDGLCLVLLTATTFVCVALRASIGAALVGLLLSQIIAVANAFQWAVRQSSECENQMIACERVLEYAELAPVEEVDLGEGGEGGGATSSAAAAQPPLPPTWPDRGALELENVCMRYRADLPLALRGISARVGAGERVGIVGRSGSGKSSTLAAILRLTVPEAGRIVIDGVDASCIPLTRLRRAIGLIPQDPHLTEGSVRKNLDPFNQYTDQQCWEALEAVQLRAVLEEKQGSGAGLEVKVEDGGGNFSVGQRQLLCLARAALRRCRILLIDEATANVDADTVTRVGRALRTAFPACSIIAVAHRLETVIDFESVWVVSEGAITEQGEPHVLLSRAGGAFSSLVSSAGPAAAAALAEAAAAAHNRRQGCST
jgi:ATP-binding cassette subfamily C (CFTR/MRP) protein 4